MAGSYNHVVKKESGQLRTRSGVLGMLETYSGDVYEAVEEMYGMIWYLASQQIENDRDYWIPDPEMRKEEIEKLVEEARQNYKEGLKKSPTKRFKK